MSYQRDFPNRLRVGVVGVGSHAYRNVLPAMHHLPVQLVAFCDTYIDLARRTAPEYGVVNCYATLGEMIANEKLDAVFLAVGASFHPQLANEAFDAGLHVWMEKPVAVRASEVEEMIRRRGDRVAVVGIKKAFMPATEKAMELFAEGSRFGPIQSILGVYGVHFPADEEAKLDAGLPTAWLDCCHPLGFMLSVGGPVRAVTTHRGGNGGAVIAFEYESGAFGNLHLVQGGLSSQPLEQFLVVGKTAHLTVDNVNRVTLQRGIPFAYGKTTNFAPPGEDSGAVTWTPQHSLGTLENKTDFTHGMVGEMMHFCEHVLAGTPATRGTLEFSLQIMRFYEASIRSRGNRVELA